MPTVLPDEDVLYAQARAHRYVTAAAHARAIGVRVQTLQKALSERPWGPGLKAIYQSNRGAQHQERVQQVAQAQERMSRERLENPDPDDEISVSTEIPAGEQKRADLNDPAIRDAVEQFAKDRGIPLDKWVPIDVGVRKYPLQLGDGVVEEADYLAVKFKPITGMVSVNVVKPRPRRAQRKLTARKGEPTLVALAGCYQIPFHDERAHELMCGFLAMVQPHRVGIIGDLRDNPDVSKYRTNPAYRAAVQDTNVHAAAVLEDVVDAAPGAQVDLCDGNHDARFEDWLLKHAGQVHDVKRPGSDVPWWHPRELLGLDALGITHHGPVGGQWSRARIQYSPVFAAMHGWRTKKATAARDTAAELGMHVAQAHTHRQALTPVTIGRDGEQYMVQAVEVGCMCVIDEGLGHTDGIADWQQGFALASVWPDGVPTFELVQIVDGALRFRGQRYTARQLKVAA